MDTLSMLSPVLDFAVVLVVIICTVVALAMLFRRNYMGFILFSGMGVMCVLFYSFAPALSDGSTKGLNPPKTKAPAEPLVSEPSADLTGLWLTLGIIGGALVLGILAVVLFSVAKRARHASLELREKQEAAAAEKAKALAVWAKSTDRHSELKAKVIEIETDWDMLFSYPALFDPTVPQTREFHRALKAADAASDEPPADLNLSMEIGALPYPKLVAAADEAWAAAWSFAQRTGTKLIPRAERRKVDQILKLLRMARDSVGSEHERSIAYGRVSKLIGELQFVRIPEAALKAIGTEAKLMIEAPAASSAPSRATEPVAIAL